MGRLHAQEGNQQEIIKREKWAHSISETQNPALCTARRAKSTPPLVSRARFAAGGVVGQCGSVTLAIFAAR
jgi:hypothetical protein